MKRLLQNTTRQTITSFDGTILCYETTSGEDNKPTLFFVHGMGGDLTAWDKERRYFQSLGFSTVALDLRGHGLSGRPRTANAYTLLHYAKDVEHIMHAQKTKYILIGHCFGGMVTLVVAGELQTPLKALALIDTSYKAPHFSEVVARHTISKILMAVLIKIPITIGRPGHTDFQRFIGTSDFDPKRIFSDVWHTSLQSYLYTSRSLLSFHGETLLSHINVPTLVIEGTKDSIFPPEIAKQLAKQIKKSHLEFIPEANHILVLNNPEELNSKIKTFLDRL